MRINNFSFEGKVAVSFNNSGNWTSLTESNTDIPAPESSFGGIGGGYSTIRVYFNIASEPLSVGTNTIHFRYNGANDSITLGYRVIAFNILDAANNPLIQTLDFVEDDPATWTAPFTDQASIDEGKDLWYNATLRSPLVGNEVMKATCGDCHAQDGRDLKYFNYSNKSIVERTVFHNLTKEDGEKIASYIRTLNVPAPENARPWNPPYQPGPGMDSKPVEEWAAGAGLAYVLDDDEEMMSYIFPEGTGEDALDQVFDIKGTLNIREMPIALQFPDWKHWLPQVHPKDMMSEAAYNQIINGIGGVRNDRPANTYGYARVRENLINNGVASYNDGSGKDLMTLLLELGAGVQDFCSPTTVPMPACFGGL